MGKEMMVKCYIIGKFLRFCSLLLIILGVFLLVNAGIHVLTQGFDSVPGEIWIAPIVSPIVILIGLIGVFSNIQVTKDKLSVVGPFWRREILKKDIVGEGRVFKLPMYHRCYSYYFFVIPVKKGKTHLSKVKKFKFQVGTEKAKNYAVKFLLGKDLSSDSHEELEYK